MTTPEIMRLANEAITADDARIIAIPFLALGLAALAMYMMYRAATSRRVGPSRPYRYVRLVRYQAVNGKRCEGVAFHTDEFRLGLIVNAYGNPVRNRDIASLSVVFTSPLYDLRDGANAEVDSN